jgi:hypothetical protein
MGIFCQRCRAGEGVTLLFRRAAVFAEAPVEPARSKAKSRPKAALPFLDALSSIWRSHILVDSARIVAVAIRTAPSRMIGWASYAEVHVIKVLRGHAMGRSAIVAMVCAVHSIAVIAGCHRRTREHKRKCGGSDYSEVRHRGFSYRRIS